MTYQETLDFLYRKLPMYQRSGKAAIKKDLTNTYALLEGLGNPHQHLKCVHIAGTNGKGTSAHTIAAILQSAGYKAGLYTSPHLKNFTERIRIDGTEADQAFVISFVEDHKDLIEKVQPSFFEVTVVMAFQYFYLHMVDLAVIEVGLGGRLDSTNVITPMVSLITQIGYDHQDLLGETLPEIAGEKAGIIKPGVPVVIGDNHKELRGLFEAKAQNSHAAISFASDEYRVDHQIEEALNIRGTDLHITVVPEIKGEYYLHNLPGILAAVDELIKAGLVVDREAIKKGIAQAASLTGLKGRWQVLRQKPLTICDVGHNEDGLKANMAQLSKLTFNQLYFVIGGVADKQWDKLIALLPKEAQFLVCQPSIPRAISAKDLAAYFEAAGLTYQIVADVNDAIDHAHQLASDDDLIFIGGSTFVVAEINDL